MLRQIWTTKPSNGRDISKNAGFKYDFKVVGYMPEKNSASARRTEPEGALVVTNRVNPGAPEKVVDELLDEGIIGQLDYDTGKSLNADELSGSNPAGKGALNNMAEFSRVGGYVVAHTKGFDRVIVGRASPDSIRFEEIKTGTHAGPVLKCAKLEVKGEITEDQFSGVYQVIRDRPQQVFSEINNPDHAERVVAAVTTLEQEGKLERT